MNEIFGKVAYLWYGGTILKIAIGIGCLIAVIVDKIKNR